jgi:hypothetical protein
LTHGNLLGIVTERAKRNDLGHRKRLIVARLGWAEWSGKSLGAAEAKSSTTEGTK